MSWSPLPLAVCPICKFVAYDARKGSCWACHAVHSPVVSAVGTHVMVLCTDHRLYPAVVVEGGQSGKLRVRFPDGSEDERVPAHVAAGVPADLVIAKERVGSVASGSVKGHEHRERSFEMVSSVGSYRGKGVEGVIAELDGGFELLAETEAPGPNLDRYLGASFDLKGGAVSVRVPRPDGSTTVVVVRPGRPGRFMEPAESGPRGVKVIFASVGGAASGLTYTIDFHSGTRRT